MRVSISVEEAARRFDELEAKVDKSEATDREIEEFRFVQEVIATSNARVPDDVRRSIKRVSTATLADVNPAAYAALLAAKEALQ